MPNSKANDKNRVPQQAPGSGIVVVMGIVAVTSMLFGFLLGLLF